MAEKAAAPPRDNLTPETYLEFYRQVREAKRKLTEAQSAHRHALKRAKAAGIDLAAMAEAIDITKRDSDEVAQHMRTVARYAAWMGQPIGTQGALFDATDGNMPSQKAAAEQHEWAADEAGYDAGRAGRNRDDHPYEVGTPLHAAWDRGWMKGQAFIAEQMGGEVPKRGRKKKSGNAEDGPGAQA